MGGASRRTAAETLNLEQVGEEPSLGAALTVPKTQSGLVAGEFFMPVL